MPELQTYFHHLMQPPLHPDPMKFALSGTVYEPDIHDDSIAIEPWLPKAGHVLQ